MSVFSKTFGYQESCVLSHEFLRRGCTFTPKEVEWAGDLVIIKEEILKHSLVNDMRGGEGEVEISLSSPNEACPTVTVELPYTVEETSIRTGGENSFEFTIPKAKDESEEKNWDLDIYQSIDDCSVLMDGGDALQRGSPQGRIVSLCGTIDIRGWHPDAWFLDNRKSYTDDPDRGCLIVTKIGLTPTHSLLYLLPDKDTSQGIKPVADDITQPFLDALAELGLEQGNIESFGMI